MHYRRTGHQDFYTGGSGVQLWCAVCDAVVRDASPTTADAVRGVDSFDPAPPIPVRHPIDAEHPPANFDG